jgi:hypothetical protein
MRKNVVNALGAIVGVVFAACSEKAGLEEAMSSDMVALEISVPIAHTKVTAAADETSISNYQVFLYDASDHLEAYVNQNSSSISLECTVGTKTVVVLCNAPAIEDVTTLSDMMKLKSSLSDNEIGSFVMSGRVSSVITTSSTEVTVPVSRLVSKVRLSKLETEFEIPQYQSMPFKVSSVYLINVPADKYYITTGSVTEWYNKTKYDSSDDNSLLFDGMGDMLVTSSASYDKKNTFYCYPNPESNDNFSSTWSPRHTRLVVEALLGDTRYYYPVTLPEIESNKIYDVNLKITRPGSSLPDIEVDKFAVGFTVQVKDWEIGASVSEEI